MALDITRIPFGLADITIGEGADAIAFDGLDELQAEGGDVTLTPVTEDIVIADYGTSPYDQRIVGYEGSVTIVAAQESIDVLQLALTASDPITETASGETVGIMDSAIGSSLRARALPVRIHPRRLPDSVRDLDIFIYKMAANGDFTRGQANEQGNVTITLNMFPRDGMDPSKPGNFFYIGGVDPNGAGAGA